MQSACAGRGVLTGDLCVYISSCSEGSWGCQTLLSTSKCPGHTWLAASHERAHPKPSPQGVPPHRVPPSYPTLRLPQEIQSKCLLLLIAWLSVSLEVLFPAIETYCTNSSPETQELQWILFVALPDSYWRMWNIICAHLEMSYRWSWCHTPSFPWALSQASHMLLSMLWLLSVLDWVNNIYMAKEEEAINNAMASGELWLNLQTICGSLRPAATAETGQSRSSWAFAKMSSGFKTSWKVPSRNWPPPRDSTLSPNILVWASACLETHLGGVPGHPEQPGQELHPLQPKEVWEESSPASSTWPSPTAWGPWMTPISPFFAHPEVPRSSSAKKASYVILWSGIDHWGHLPTFSKNGWAGPLMPGLYGIPPSPPQMRENINYTPGVFSINFW